MILILKIVSILFMALLFHYAKGSGSQSAVQGYNSCLLRLIAILWILVTLASMMV